MSLKKIYLDNNATTAMDPRVLEVVVKDLQETVGNPSSIHSFGQQARQKLAKARQTIAAAIGVKPQEIVFTSGGSEGANYILRGLLTPQTPGHILTSSVEHSCIYKTVQYLETLGAKATFLHPGALGAITPEAVKQALNPSTKLIALTAVNNETGVKTDVEAIAALAAEVKVPFLVDGVALLGKEPFTIPPGVSAMIFSGHKIHAPKGIGFVFVRSSLKLQPLLIGGEQESGRRAGSENLSGIAGLAEAVRLLKDELPQAQEKMKALGSSGKFLNDKAFECENQWIRSSYLQYFKFMLFRSRRRNTFNGFGFGGHCSQSWFSVCFRSLRTFACFVKYGHSA